MVAESIKIRPRFFNQATYLIIIALAGAILCAVLFKDLGFFILAGILFGGLILGLIFNFNSYISVEGNDFIQSMPFKGKIIVPISKIERLDSGELLGRSGILIKLNKDYLIKERPDLSYISKEYSILASNFSKGDLDKFVGYLKYQNKNIKINESIGTTKGRDTVKNENTGFFGYFYRGLPELVNQENKPGYSELMKEINFLRQIRKMYIIFLISMIIVTILAAIFLGIYSIFVISLLILVVGLNKALLGLKTLKIMDRFADSFDITIPVTHFKSFFRTRGNFSKKVAYLNLAIGLLIILTSIAFVFLALFAIKSGITLG